MSQQNMPPLPKHPWRSDPTPQWYDEEEASIHAYARAYAAQRVAPLVEALGRIVDWDRAGLALTEDHIAQAEAALAAEQEAART